MNARTYPKKTTSYSVTAAQDDTELLAAVPNKRLRILGLAITSNSVASASLGHWIFKSVGAVPSVGGQTTALSGSMQVSSQGLVLPLSATDENWWFETDNSASFFFSTTSASGSLLATYAEVTS